MILSSVPIGGVQSRLLLLETIQEQPNYSSTWMIILIWIRKVLLLLDKSFREFNTKSCILFHLTITHVSLFYSGMDVVDKINSKWRQIPDQKKIISEGNTYLLENFPDLTYIISVTPTLQ
jgi:hypothetical protein